MINNFDPTYLEKTVGQAILDAGVTDTVYYDRPKAAPVKNHFAVVRVSGNITDQYSYGECTLEVSFFAKDVQNFKNGKRLSFMQKTFLENYPTSGEFTEDDTVVGSYLFANTPTCLGDSPDDYGFHARIFNLSTIIKSI